MIVRQRDQFELSNPGTLLLSIQQIISGGVSECRNKTLQKMFSLIGGGEKAGSGVDKIRQGWKTQHWRWPWLRVMAEPNRIRWTLPTVSLLSDETIDYLERRFDTKFKHLSEIGRMALVLAHEESCVTNARLQQVSTVHPADISRELKGLVKDGFLDQARSGRWAEYRLPHKESSLPHKESSLPHKTLESPTFAELAALRSKATVSEQSGRLPPERTREIIAEVCSEHYLTAEEIADLLARSVKTIRTHLRAMVQSRQLFHKYPHDPTRSDQAYTSNTETNQD